MSELVKTVNLSQEEKVRRKKELMEVHNQTGLMFLKKHNGFRDNKMHVILGRPSDGKSTLRNTIMKDFLESNPGKQIFLYLSEEKADDFLNDLSHMIDHEVFNGRVHIYSELDAISEGHELIPRDSINELCLNVLKYEANILLFDNLTTSRVYGETFNEQTRAIQSLKPQLNSLGVPSVFFTHTGKAIKQSHKDMIDMNENRGTGGLPSVAEFFYILQSFTVDGFKNNTLRIVKHRGYSINNPYHYLDYDHKEQLYNKITEVPFERINRLFQDQDRLGKRKESNNLNSPDQPSDNRYGKPKGKYGDYNRW